MKPTHGGKRKGAGRKPGKPRAKLQITLPKTMVASMDKRRGDVSRSEWIEAMLKGSEL